MNTILKRSLSIAHIYVLNFAAWLILEASLWQSYQAYFSKYLNGFFEWNVYCGDTAFLTVERGNFLREIAPEHVKAHLDLSFHLKF